MEKQRKIVDRVDQDAIAREQERLAREKETILEMAGEKGSDLEKEETEEE